MSSSRIILKQNETYQLSVSLPTGVSSVSYRASDSVISVDSAGLITALVNPSSPQTTFVSVKDEYGIDLEVFSVCVIPDSLQATDVSFAADSTLGARYLKNGETTTFIADIGQGPHVGLEYQSSNPILVSVDSSGNVSVLQNVSEVTPVVLSAKDNVTGISVTSAILTIVPQSVNKSAIPRKVAVTAPKNVLKQNQTTQISANLGKGNNVGVTFTSSDPSIGTVSSQGLVTAVVNPASAKPFRVTISDTATGIALDALQFTVIPNSVPLNRVQSVKSVYSEVFDVPTGGSLSLQTAFSNVYNSNVLRVYFTLPTALNSPVSKAKLTLESNDKTVVKASNMEIVHLSSPIDFNNVDFTKPYTATLVATTDSGFRTTIVATFEELGWNNGGWNTRGYGL